MALDDAVIRELIERAQQARARAYAPYSNYFVGAALLGRSGEIFEGANVENASYSATMCAERASVFTAVTQGEREFEAIVVVSDSGAAPCGSCRQVLSEFGRDPLVVLADADGNIREQTSLNALLPHAFGPEDLVQA